MKYVLMVFLALVCAAAGGLGTAYYVDVKFTEKFNKMAGITYQEFEDAYVNCVFKSGELCNLFGGFAPKSQFTNNKPDII